MARLRRIACFIAAPIAAGAMLGTVPAGAQFFNPLEALFGPPPRPPSSVPGRQPGPQQQGYPSYPDQRYPGPRYPEQQYPDQPYPGQARESPPAGVQSQPLPPPEGAAAAIDPSLAPGGRQPRGAPQPADIPPPPGDESVAEPPSQKIANKSALFSGLDKITGRIIAFDAAVGETVQFGALQVTPRVCYTRPPTETSNTDAFIEVDEVTLQGEIKRIFTGWMFASSPGLHAVEHPIYDVWLTDCKNPVIAAAPAPELPPATAAPTAKPAATATPPRRGNQQPAPQLAAPQR
jgi:hypothetical protein